MEKKDDWKQETYDLFNLPATDLDSAIKQYIAGQENQDTSYTSGYDQLNNVVKTEELAVYSIIPLERAPHVEENDRIIVSSAVDEEVESVAHYEQYKGQKGRVVTVHKVLRPQGEEYLYNVYVLMDKKGIEVVFYDTELSVI